MKQELVTKTRTEEALDFSKKCLVHLNRRKYGDEIECPCCGTILITGGSQWVSHTAAIKAWVTMRTISVKRSQAARKANKTRKDRKEKFDKISVENTQGLIDKSLLLELDN